MEFEEFSKKAVKQIDKQLSQLLQGWRKEVKNTDIKLLPLVDKFIAGCDGGKKLRGILVVLGYEIAAHLPGVKAHLGGEITKIAAAYEIMHSAILAHDDIIDQSIIRKDKPSLYQALGGNHYGISQAISLADYGFFLSFKLISESNFPAESKISALELFSQVMMDTSLGEMLDLEKADPLIVAKLKTAYYTISGPLQLGAILGGAESQKLLNNLVKFGENLGIAFQIRDDILDAEARIWGGIDKAKKEAEKYKMKAMEVLPEIAEHSVMSKILEQMAEYLVERNK